MSWIRERNLERTFLLLIAVVLGFLFMKLFAILQKDFDNTPKRLAEGSIINLNDGKPGDKIQSLLTNGFYFEDPADIRLAAQVVTQHFMSATETIENIGALNKRLFNIPTDVAYSQGGESYKKRAVRALHERLKPRSEATTLPSSHLTTLVR